MDPSAPREATLPDGTPVVVRPLRPEDQTQIHDGFEHLSNETKHRRFLAVMKRLPPLHEHAITHVDGRNHLAWGIGVRDRDGHEIGIGVARLVRDPALPTHGEYAIVVVDEWQRRGVGKVLTRALAARSLQVGITHWTAVMFLDNRAVQEVLADVAEEVARRVPSPGVGEIEYRLRGAS